MFFTCSKFRIRSVSWINITKVPDAAPLESVVSAAPADDPVM